MHHENRLVQRNSIHLVRERRKQIVLELWMVSCNGLEFSVIQLRFPHGLSVPISRLLQQLRDNSRPTRLVARADTRPCPWKHS